jgi:hypothetical protein
MEDNMTNQQTVSQNASSQNASFVPRFGSFIRHFTFVRDGEQQRGTSEKSSFDHFMKLMEKFEDHVSVFVFDLKDDDEIDFLRSWAKNHCEDDRSLSMDETLNQFCLAHGSSMMQFGKKVVVFNESHYSEIFHQVNALIENYEAGLTRVYSAITRNKAGNVRWIRIF